MKLITRHLETLTAEEIDGFLDFVQENLEGIKPKKLKRVLLGLEMESLLRLKTTHMDAKSRRSES